ncbi:MAG: AGE family epimerase/isomerase [Ignavibacteriaceae bacterium]
METQFKHARLYILFLLIFFLITCTGGTNEKRQLKNITIDNDSIAVEMEHALIHEFNPWYPLSVDSVYGGFLSNINYKWEPDGGQNKFIVTQARHIWSTSNAAMYYNNPELTKIAEHGFYFLKEIMWDKKFGGFYDLTDRVGIPIPEGGEIIKKAYGNAFAIFGLSVYYKASGNEEALKLARETFNWIEKNCYDPEYGGYFQFIARNGEPFKDGYGGVAPKDQNSSIHILEAFTELYKVWPDQKLRERLTSLLHIIRDTITTEKGYLVLFSRRNWTPISFRNADKATRDSNYYFDHVSYGHDVETAYLMLEASEVLGIHNDTVTLKIAKKMVDHALQNGWDQEYGGIYDGGYYFDNDKKAAVVRDTKEWWAQAEAFNSFLLMSRLFPNDKTNYYEKFCKQWEYVKKYLLDKEYGGWYHGGIDKVPDEKYSPKSTIWKCNYHTSRSLINCLKILKSKELQD